MADQSNNSLMALSDAMANAVSHAAEYTLLVAGRERMPASGIALGTDLVLTANHVVERDDDIKVILPDGTELQAQVTGRDPGTDIAVLKVSGAGLVIAEKASQPAQVGQIVLALGRPSTEGIQASLGVVSAVSGPARTRRGGMLENYIRTDAIPYPGFSGGPLINATGQVIGLNTSGLAHGASLVIPAEFAWHIAEALVEHGGIKRGYLGVRSQLVDLSPTMQQALGRKQETGLLLMSVESGSPAEKGGLLVGDILVGLAGEPVAEHDELVARLIGDLVGKTVAIDVLRGGQPSSVSVTLGEFQQHTEHPRHGWRRRR